MPLLASDRERRLWLWTLAVVASIYTTLGFAGTLTGVVGDQGLNAATFVLGALLILAAVVVYGLRGRPGGTEIFIALGVTAVTSSCSPG